MLIIPLILGLKIFEDYQILQGEKLKYMMSEKFES